MAAYIFAIVSSFTTGAATALGKWNLEWISPLLMNAFMFTIATAIMSLWLAPSGRLKRIGRITRRGWFWLGLFSVSSWAAVLLFWAGVQKMDPTLAAFLNRSQVMVAILLGIVFLGGRFNRTETVGALISIAGIVIMRLTLRVEYSLGFWLVLAGSIVFGVTELLSKIAVAHVEPVILTYVRNAFLAVAYWIVFWVLGYTFTGLEHVWAGVIVVAIAGPIIGRLLYVMALERMELSKVAVISQTQPVWVILIAVALLGQLPTVREVAGGICLVGGTVLMIVGRKPRFRNFQTGRPI